jgi:hypothetical protein
MRTPTRREALLTVAYAALTVVLLFWLWGRDATHHTSATGVGPGSVDVPSSFTISGDVRGVITPGVMLPLDLRLDNPNDVGIAIDRITVTVQDVDAPRADMDHPCSVGDFAVRQLSGGVLPTLAANGRNDLSGMGRARRRWPAVGMLNRPVNQDGCKGAVLTLGYEASGTQAHR